MQIIDVSVSRGTASSWIRGANGDGVLVLRGAFELPLGSAVTLRVFLDGTRGGFYLDGVVQWRRVGVPSRSQAPALGVRYLASETEKVKFLERWGDRAELSALRTEWRYPYVDPAVMVTSRNGSARIYACSWRDISYGGAGLTIAHRLEDGESVRCEWSTGRGTNSVAAKVEWCLHGQVGVRAEFASESERQTWFAHVDRVRASLRACRVVPNDAPREAPRRAEVAHSRLSSAGVAAVIPEVAVARQTPRNPLSPEGETLNEGQRREPKLRDPRRE